MIRLVRALCALVCTSAFLLAGAVAHAQSGKTEVLWLGQAAFKITTPKGKVIVIDPYLTKNPKTPEKYKDLKALRITSYNVCYTKLLRSSSRSGCRFARSSPTG